jgi:hypothetical protein
MFKKILEWKWQELSDINAFQLAQMADCKDVFSHTYVQRYLDNVSVLFFFFFFLLRKSEILLQPDTQRTTTAWYPHLANIDDVFVSRYYPSYRALRANHWESVPCILLFLHFACCEINQQYRQLYLWQSYWFIYLLYI